VFASSRDFRLGSSASFDASGGDFRFSPADSTDQRNTF